MEKSELSQDQRKVICLLADSYWLSLNDSGWHFYPGGLPLSQDTDLGGMLDAGIIRRLGGSNRIELTDEGAKMSRGMSY